EQPTTHSPSLQAQAVRSDGAAGDATGACHREGGAAPTLQQLCGFSAPTLRKRPAPAGPAGTPHRVLEELRVENLLLIERAELRLGPGLNVLTGETGAGKTVLAHALHLLLGGRPRRGIVRPGASEAYVEGVFDLPDD